MWLPASAFISTFGAPTLTSSNAIWPAWLLDGASQEVVATSLRSDPFATWATFDADVYWTPVSGSGDVVFQMAHSANMYGGDEPVTIPTFGTKTTVTANTIKVTTLLSGVSVPVTGRVLGLRVDRHGGDAPDTLDSIDIRVFGVQLRKAS